ncbi:MAG: LCP family protein [Acetobacteraceae bacterium]|nr:LCP family protein [Acetobacteraceae bacterium]
MGWLRLRPRTRRRRAEARPRRAWAWGVTVAAVAGMALLLALWRWPRPDAVLPPAPDRPAPAPEGAPRVILLMGIDRRDPADPGRCDVVMLVTLEGGGQPLGCISLRRDSLVKIPGRGWDKVNHSYAFGGPELARQTLAWLIDRPVDHYVAVYFEGFRDLVDLVGGVEVDIPQRLYHYDPDERLLIDLGPGRLRLNGAQTLNYCRFRADPEGDLGRMRRQQEVVKQLARKLAQPAMVVRLPALIRIGLEMVRTDLTLPQALALTARAGRMLENQEMQAHTVEGRSVRLGPEGEWYVLNDVVDLRSRIHALLTGGDPPAELLDRARAAQAEIEAAADAMGRHDW